MKIEGTKKELKDLFKDKEPFKFPKISLRWMDNMNPRVRGTLMGLFFCLIILTLLGGGAMIYKDNDSSYIKTYQCDLKVQYELANALELQEEHWIGGILYLYYDLIKWLLIAIGIAWILHGVGFHIIKR